MDRISIFDTTLRDGEQAPGFSMNVEEKLKMARQLERLQVDIIEAGFPIASEGDFEAVKRISAEIRSVTIAGLARAVPADIDRCWQALEGAARPRIHTFLATSDIHLKYKFNKNTSITISPQSHDLRVAKLSGRGVFTNDEMEVWIDRALDAGIASIDVWYFIGMPEQDSASVAGTLRDP